jgi:hypothetical protein
MAVSRRAAETLPVGKRNRPQVFHPVSGNHRQAFGVAKLQERRLSEESLLGYFFHDFG